MQLCVRIVVCLEDDYKFKGIIYYWCFSFASINRTIKIIILVIKIIQIFVIIR